MSTRTLRQEINKLIKQLFNGQRALYIARRESPVQPKTITLIMYSPRVLRVINKILCSTAQRYRFLLFSFTQLRDICFISVNELPFRLGP